MKKLTLASAVKAVSALAITTVPLSAFAAPDIYGQIRMSMVYEKDSRTELATGNSRLGFKGKEALTANTDLEYQLEYRVQVAETDGTNFSPRHGFLRLNNKQYGSLLFGRTLTQDEYISNGVAWWRGVGVGFDFGYDASWASNTFVYKTPKFADGKVSALVQYGMDEGATGSRVFPTHVSGVATNKSRDFGLVGVNFDGDKTTAGATYTRAGDDLSSLRGSVTHKLNDQLTVNALAQYTDYNSNDNEIGVFAGVAYKVSEPVTVWVEGSFADNYAGVANAEVKQINLGAQYDFSKTTLAFANVGYKDAGSTDSHGVEVGMVHRF